VDRLIVRRVVAAIAIASMAWLGVEGFLGGGRPSIRRIEVASWVVGDETRVAVAMSVDKGYRPLDLPRVGVISASPPQPASDDIAAMVFPPPENDGGEVSWVTSAGLTGRGQVLSLFTLPPPSPGSAWEAPGIVVPDGLPLDGPVVITVAGVEVSDVWCTVDGSPDTCSVTDDGTVLAAVADSPDSGAVVRLGGTIVGFRPVGERPTDLLQASSSDRPETPIAVMLWGGLAAIGAAVGALGFGAWSRRLPSTAPAASLPTDIEPWVAAALWRRSSRRALDAWTATAIARGVLRPVELHGSLRLVGADELDPALREAMDRLPARARMGEADLRLSGWRFRRTWTCWAREELRRRGLLRQSASRVVTSLAVIATVCAAAWWSVDTRWSAHTLVAVALAAGAPALVVSAAWAATMQTRTAAAVPTLAALSGVRTRLQSASADPDWVAAVPSDELPEWSAWAVAANASQRWSDAISESEVADPADRHMVADVLRADWSGVRELGAPRPWNKELLLPPIAPQPTSGTG